MKSACDKVLFLALLLLNLASQTGMAATPADATSIRIELSDGLLSAEFHDALLPQVLAEIGKSAGFKLVQIDDFNDFPRITGSIDNQPWQVAVERLVANTNRIFFFLPADSAESARVISQLWLLGPGEAGVDIRQRPDIVSGLQHEEPIIRSQAVLHLVQQQGVETGLQKLY